MVDEHTRSHYSALITIAGLQLKRFPLTCGIAFKGESAVHNVGMLKKSVVIDYN